MKTYANIRSDGYLSDEELDEALDLIRRIETNTDYFLIMTAARQFKEYMEGVRTGQAIKELVSYREKYDR